MIGETNIQTCSNTGITVPTSRYLTLRAESHSQEREMHNQQWHHQQCQRWVNTVVNNQNKEDKRCNQKIEQPHRDCRSGNYHSREINFGNHWSIGYKAIATASDG